MSTILLAALVVGAAPGAKNALLEELIKEGLPIAGGPRLKLPAPSLPDGASPAKQQAVLDKLSADFPRGLLTRKSLNAPYVLKIRSLPGKGGKRRGHTLDLWFVAHGKLADVEKKKTLDQLLGLDRRGKSASKTEYLSAKQLAARKLKVPAGTNPEERYSKLNTILVDKVQLTGVTHSMTTRTPKSVTAASVLDERFGKDKEFPNVWRLVKSLPSEKLRVGLPKPYAGFGGYVKVTELSKPAGALLVEMHFAFHEPYGWFSGHNVLGSKLPLAIKDSVQTFRRRLSKP
jgi:hypothetical protein